MVALRKESVDRNTCLTFPPIWTLTVALRKESVDRNMQPRFCVRVLSASLSARRAWIEIPLWYVWNLRRQGVALRKGSVDRNTTCWAVILAAAGSLSARRAWIEITSDVSERESLAVALRKESVDRNSSMYAL